MNDNAETIKNQELLIKNMKGLIGSYCPHKRGSVNQDDGIALLQKENQKIVEGLISQRSAQKGYLSPIISIHKLKKIETKDWRLATFHFAQYLFGKYLFNMLGIINILCGIVYYEIDYSLLKKEQYCHNQSDCLRYIQSNSNLNLSKDEIQSLTIIIRYDSVQLEWIKLICLIFIFLVMILEVVSYTVSESYCYKYYLCLQKIFNNDTMWTFKNFYLYFFKCLLKLIGPYFFISNINVNYFGTHEIRINYFLLTFFLLIRMIQILKGLLDSHYYYSLRAQRIGKMFHQEINQWFVFKSLLYTNPIIIIMIIFTANLLYGAYLFRILEGCIVYAFSFYENCVWFSILTMTTVGNGQYSDVQTIPGRIMAIIMTLVNYALFAIILFSLKTFLALKNNEHKALKVIQIYAFKQRFSLLSKKLLTTAMRITALTKKQEEHRNKGEEIESRKLGIKINELKRSKESNLKKLHTFTEQLSQIKSPDYTLEISQAIESLYQLISTNQSQLDILKKLVADSKVNSANIATIKTNLLKR